MGNVRLGLMAEIAYDGATWSSTCLVAGVSEDTSQWRAKGSMRIDGMFSDGKILPYAAVSISDSLNGGNTVTLGTAVVTSDPGTLFGAEAGLTAFVGQRTALFANVGITEGLQNDVTGCDGSSTGNG